MMPAKYKVHIMKTTTISFLGVLIVTLLASYKVNAQQIKIGNQTWSTINLNVSTFRNGDTIPEVKTNEEWEKTGIDGKPAWCYYDNDPSNGKKYGKLYNWFAVSDVRGLAPKGWHIPKSEQWKILTDYLGGTNIAGTKMKSTTGWANKIVDNSNGNGTNSSGFMALPGGYRSKNGKFGDYEGYVLGLYGYWWSSTEEYTYSAYSRSLNNSNGIVYGSDYMMAFGMSVRCLKD